MLLDRGVQDVVELPVSRRKLGSRVRAMGRTMQLAIARRSAIDEIHVGADVLITPGTRSVKVGEAEVNLTLSEFEVLLTLAHRKGEVLTKSQIIQSLGRDATVRALDTHISRLRAKLRLAGAGEIIETAHGVGYRLTGGPPEI